ncbi:hypothetical protein ACFY2H_37510 [Streptomyces griseofuscus]|uniref:hypothetical protein n=1 Tax=Streptomyces griseofuscus TaxID=146922 RepID=UPI00369FA11B
MTITVPLLLLLGVATLLLVRYEKLSVGAALVAIAFGFLLADTGAAPAIHHLVSSLLSDVQSLRLRQGPGGGRTGDAAKRTGVYQGRWAASVQ